MKSTQNKPNYCEERTEGWKLTVYGYSRIQSISLGILVPPELVRIMMLFYSHSTIFPSIFQYSGYLNIRFKSNRQWKQRYFVINNNSLFMAMTSTSTQLAGLYPLYGVKVKPLNSKTSELTLEITIRTHRMYLKTTSSKQRAKWIVAIQNASKWKIKDTYRFLYSLGRSEVVETHKVVAAKHKVSNEKSAIKIIDKRNCDKTMLKTMLKTEMSLLRTMKYSPYNVKLYELIETKKYLYFVMEICNGGQLFQQIAALNDNQYITEQVCVHIAKQIASGTKCMHEKGIIFRDLKPVNILCVNPNCITRVKIADFGISKMLVHGNNPNNNANNVDHNFYTAPEILQRKEYDQSVDYWNIGVILYMLLCGYKPFWRESPHYFDHSMDTVWFKGEDWRKVSQEMVNLVNGLLSKQASNRKTCDDILKLAKNASSAPLNTIKHLKSKLMKKRLFRERFPRRNAAWF